MTFHEKHNGRKGEQTNQFLVRLSLILIFLLSIFLPVLKMVLTERKEISEVEKRRLTGLPVFHFGKKSLNSYPSRFEAYLNDHFGFRDDLIFFRNFIIFNLLKKSPVPSVAIGKNNWLFYKTDTFGISLIDDFRGLITLTPLQLEAMRVHLETKRNWLKSKGIKYLYVLVPNKQSIYPEFLPDTFHKVKNKTQIDQLLEYLTEKSDLPILDLRPALLQAKNKYPLLYHQTDSHWNGLGAYIAYKTIMDRLQIFFPELTIIDKEDIEITSIDESRRDLATLMGLPDITEKNVPSVILKSTNTSQNFNPGWALKSWPNWIQPFETNNESATLRAIVFRDSFMDMMLPFFSKHFRKAAYIASKFDYSILDHLIGRIKPDIVIEEGIERHTFIAFLPETIHTTIGNDMLINGKINEAILEFRKSLSQNPNDPDGYNNIGVALLRAQRVDEAIIQFKKAIKCDPANAKALNNLHIALKIVKIDAEIAEIRNKIITDKTNSDLLARLGLLYFEKGLPDKAIFYFNKAYSIQPSNIDALKNLAIVYSTKKNYDISISFLLKALNVNPNQPELYYNISCLYSQNNKIKESMEFLKLAIERGYKNYELIKSDADLENIRHTAEYKDVIQKLITQNKLEDSKSSETTF